MSIIKRVSKYLINKLLSISGLTVYEACDLTVGIDVAADYDKEANILVDKTRYIEPIKLATSMFMDKSRETEEQLISKAAYWGITSMTEDIKEHLKIEVSPDKHDENVIVVTATLIILPKDTFK